MPEVVPGGESYFHRAAGFLTSSPGRCSPRQLLKTSDFEKLEHPAYDV